MWCLFALLAVGMASTMRADDPASVTLLSAGPASESIWADGIGSGYVKRARIIDLKFSRGIGFTNFGSDVKHDLLLGTVSFAQSFNDVWVPERWYGGNLFWTGELMGGVEDDPDEAYLMFGNIGLRYEFATQIRFMPFLECAVGAGATAVGEPDLSEGIQFVSRIRVGARYYFNDRISMHAGFGYLHISNAGHSKPNGGINSYMFSLGVGWAFNRVSSQPR
jgi:hypothetical protein